MPEQVTIVREWDADTFHARVLELEKQGWVSRRETYRVTAEMNPETGCRRQPSSAADQVAPLQGICSSQNRLILLRGFA